ncbi:hypothetical protein SPHINGOAX6_70562 [Sphingomonas sp. AX6]|nr:hypothetical protein SPHINGOAX6_70562 [Sphingomonas sp. AX6]
MKKMYVSIRTNVWVNFERSTQCQSATAL